MPFLEANIALLRGRFPGLAEELEKTGADGGRECGNADEWDGSEADICVETAAQGSPSLRVKGLYAHSRQDPKREAERLVKSLFSGGESCRESGPSAGPVIVLGFGLGYGAEEAARLFPERPIIIVERHASLLRKALECRDQRPLLNLNLIAFVLGGDGGGVIGALRLFEKTGEKSQKPILLKNRALVDLNKEWYGRVEGQVQAWQSRDDINSATLKRFGKRWVRNLARNMEAIRDLPGISLLAGLAAAAGADAAGAGRAVPVFLAAAGPSLDEAGPLLTEIAKRCFIVAVDTSLRFLLAHGIEPDFAVVVDPQYWNARHLDRSAAPRTCLIAESAVYPAVLRQTFKSRFLCGSLFPLGRFIEERVDPKGELGAGGSVATTAWDFSRVLGPSSIWIAGLDLSFPALKTHFRGALFEDRSHAESLRLFPAETWSARALRDGQPFRAPASPAGEVLTDRRLALYAAWFENRFKEYPSIRNYRLGGPALAISGLENAAIDALLALPERRKEIDLRLEAVFSRVKREFYSAGAVSLRAEKYDKARKSLLGGLKTIYDAALEAAKTAETGFRTRDRARLLAKLDAANRAVTESAVKDVAGFLFPPLEELEAGLTSPARDPYKRHLELSAKLYQALAEATAYTLKILT